jgi:hypothetical protein
VSIDVRLPLHEAWGPVQSVGRFPRRSRGQFNEIQAESRCPSDREADADMWPSDGLVNRDPFHVTKPAGQGRADEQDSHALPPHRTSEGAPR